MSDHEKEVKEYDFMKIHGKFAEPATPSAPVSGLVAEIDALLAGVDVSEGVRLLDKFNDHQNGNNSLEVGCWMDDHKDALIDFANAWPRLKSALASRDEWHDFFYDRACWETTYPKDLEAECFADYPDPGVYRMGRLRELTDKFVAVYWDDGGQVVLWFDTEEQANAALPTSQERKS